MRFSFTINLQRTLHTNAEMRVTLVAANYAAGRFWPTIELEPCRLA
jgi:hypothetical protein